MLPKAIVLVYCVAALLLLAIFAAPFFATLFAIYMLTNRASSLDVWWFLSLTAAAVSWSALSIWAIAALYEQQTITAIAPATAIGGAVVCVFGALVTRQLSARRRSELSSHAASALDGSNESYFLFLRPFKTDRETSSEFNGYLSALNVLRRYALLGIGWVFGIPRSLGYKDVSVEGAIERMVTWISAHHPMNTEYVLSRATERLGVLVAVGLERGPCNGASRVICDDATWKDTVHRLAQNAKLLVFVPGLGDGTAWEIENVVGPHRRKAVVIMPPGASSRAIVRGGWDSDDWMLCAMRLTMQGIEIPSIYENRGAAFRHRDSGTQETRGLPFLRGDELRKRLAPLLH